MADGGRKWEELEMDCLSIIFSKVGLDDLSVSLPFVCRSWFAAAHDPLCWKLLNLRSLNFMPWSAFPRRFSDRNSVSRFSFSGFMKLAVRRSDGGAADLRLPELGSMEDLILASNKDFEELAIPCSSIKKEDASAIVAHLPKLRSLDLSRSIVSKGDFVAILEGCGELVRLNARDCVGFGAGDEEIMRRGCRIRVLEMEGSKVEDDGGYETDECDDRYVHVI